MSDAEDLASLREAYKQLTVAILTSAIKGRSDVASRFYTLPSEKQSEIESEIDRRAGEIAESMCRKLESHGFLRTEPTDAELARLYRETLKEFESR